MQLAEQMEVLCKLTQEQSERATHVAAARGLTGHKGPGWFIIYSYRGGQRSRWYVLCFYCGEVVWENLLPWGRSGAWHVKQSDVECVSVCVSVGWQGGWERQFVLNLGVNKV